MRIGRYVLERQLASGGMGSVYLGHIVGEGGFTRRVAIKKLHDHVSLQPGASEMFLREARIAGKIHHRNVVDSVDFLSHEGKLYHVMEYVEGESLAKILSTVASSGIKLPPEIALRIVVDVLHGLHAAHETKDDAGKLLEVVHRDVSPQNVLVGLDGLSRVADFGIAKTATHHTAEGSGLRGKIRYVAPEQIRGEAVSRATDIYSACVVAWESLALRPLFQGDNEALILARVLEGRIPSLAKMAPDASPVVVASIERGLARRMEDRPQDARRLAIELENTGLIASHEDVAMYIETTFGDAVRAQGKKGDIALSAAERTSTQPLARRRSKAVERWTAKPDRKGLPRWALLAAIVLILTGVGGGMMVAKARTALAPTFATTAQTVSILPFAVPTGSAPLVEPLAPIQESATATPSATTLRVRAQSTKPKPESMPKDCMVPYTVDERGIRHPKPECM